MSGALSQVPGLNESSIPAPFLYRFIAIKLGKKTLSLSPSLSLSLFLSLSLPLSLPLIYIIYTHTHIYIHVYIHIYTYTHTHTYTYIHIYAYMYTHTHLAQKRRIKQKIIIRVAGGKQSWEVMLHELLGWFL
jgi:hypothetical protein